MDVVVKGSCIKNVKKKREINLLDLILLQNTRISAKDVRLSVIRVKSDNTGK